MIHFNTHTEFLKHAKPEHVIIEAGDWLWTLAWKLNLCDLMNIIDGSIN